MAEHNLQAFLAVVRQDSALQEQLSSTAAADVDTVAAMARDLGYDIHPNDFVAYGDGILVDYDDEDYFLKPLWWRLATGS